MSDTKNVSPVGWYVGSYLLRFIELDAADNDDPDAKFDCWENTVIVTANDLDEAYDKIVAIATGESRPYRGGDEGVPVQWVFEGVTDLLPIYEPLRDGAEIMWGEHDDVPLSRIREWVRGRGQFVR
ncbi:DUF4288 domain-containing protein [Lysobacter sp. K5869]|uniref:DUF4288 domain-containing protein n=1 Tax=Lysobacter sp. K5869 TaxID=2820808 RepID=UPI001C05F5A9|nr:DUF4288 domain-containing protein [Lysobacter sp. K5869]QWP75837.1 DUF4288 domain-containing protein [Lysobacter sp. K5869]